MFIPRKVFSDKHSIVEMLYAFELGKASSEMSTIMDCIVDIADGRDTDWVLTEELLKQYQSFEVLLEKDEYQFWAVKNEERTLLFSLNR